MCVCVRGGGMDILNVCVSGVDMSSFHLLINDSHKRSQVKQAASE